MSSLDNYISISDPFACETHFCELALAARVIELRAPDGFEAQLGHRFLEPDRQSRRRRAPALGVLPQASRRGATELRELAAQVWGERLPEREQGFVGLRFLHESASLDLYRMI